MNPTRKPAALLLILVFLAFLLLSIAPTEAATASALLREGDPLPGFSPVNSIIHPAVNHAGGYSLTINTNEAGSIVSHIWGNAAGGPGALLITEGTYGNYEQNSFESFHGLSDAGDPGYSAVADEVPAGDTGLDGVWVDTTPILVEGEQIPTLPLAYSTFNSRPGISADGQPYWVGGFSSSPGGSTENRALFLGVGSTPILKGGDSIGGIPETVIPGSGGIDFNYRFSEFATNYVMECLINTGSSATDGIVVKNGDLVILPGDGCMCEAEPVPTEVGGLPGEFWSSFDYFGINEDGLFMVTGDTSAAVTEDEFVFVGDEIVLREGTALVTPQGFFTVSGAIESAYMNEDGDWAVTWDLNDAMAVNREALLFNGRLQLMEGNAVDLDGDGEVEPDSILVDFTGIASLALSDRDGSEVSIYFTADIDTEGTPTSSDDTEALFRMTLTLVGPNSPPVAICQDVTVEAGSSCEADADVDGGSFDPDGDSITLEQEPPGPYGLGETQVTLTVMDSHGLPDHCIAIVTVVPEPLQLTVNDQSLDWGPTVCDTGYDVVRGDLGALLPSGDFSGATVECLANDVATTTVGYTNEPGSAGEGEWYLVRRIGADGNGSYDSGGESQQGSRDAGIAGSGADCP